MRLIKARGVTGMSKAHRTWPNKGSEAVESSRAKQMPRFLMEVSHTPCFQHPGSVT